MSRLLLIVLAAALVTGCAFNGAVDVEANNDLPGPAPDAGSGPDASELPPDAATDPELCGNGQLDPGEACEDGNEDSGDGCSSACHIEDGFVCDNLGVECWRVKRLAIVEPFELVGITLSVAGEQLSAASCDDGAVVVGLHGFLSAEDQLVGIRGLCGDPAVNDAGDLAWLDSESTDIIGREGADSEKSSCAEDELMVGFALESDGGLTTGIAPLCAPVSITGGKPKIGTSTVGTLVGSAGSSSGEARCGQGRAVGRGLAAHATSDGGGQFDGFAVLCGEVAVVAGASDN